MAKAALEAILAQAAPGAVSVQEYQFIRIKQYLLSPQKNNDVKACLKHLGI